jgi:hypothetical protein
MNAHQRRIAECLGVRGPPAQLTRPVALSLEEFFDGNSDDSSIGCNLHPRIGLDVFRAELEAFRDRDDVSGVWVLVTQWDEPDWPFSDRIIIATSLSNEDILEALAPLSPSEIVGMDAATVRQVRGAAEHELVAVCWD